MERWRRRGEGDEQAGEQCGPEARCVEPERLQRRPQLRHCHRTRLALGDAGALPLRRRRVVRLEVDCARAARGVSLLAAALANDAADIGGEGGNQSVAGLELSDVCVLREGHFVLTHLRGRRGVRDMVLAPAVAHGPWLRLTAK